MTRRVLALGLLLMSICTSTELLCVDGSETEAATLVPCADPTESEGTTSDSCACACTCQGSAALQVPSSPASFVAVREHDEHPARPLSPEHLLDPPLVRPPLV